MNAATIYVVLAALVSQVTAAGTFVQCADGGSLLRVTDGPCSNVLDTVGTLLGNVLFGQCQTMCQNGGYDYTLWSPALSLVGINLLNMCYCANSDKWIPSAQYNDVANSGSTCFKGGLIGLNLVRPDWQVTWNKPGPWQFSTCLTGATLTGGMTTTVANSEQCFTSCKLYKYAALTFNGASMGCTCGTILSGGTAAKCGDVGTWTVGAARKRALGTGASTFFLNAEPEISAAPGLRRALQNQLQAEANAQKYAYCPRGLVGCLIPGSAQYECIDPQTELESCGGCANGYYGGANATDGVDCTTLPGVAVGGVSCHQGQCAISKCAPGWLLDNKVCVRNGIRGIRL